MFNTIYIKLLDEGVAVYRPVLSKKIDGTVYMVGQRIDDDEKWEFEPNEIVDVEEYSFKDGVKGLIAVNKHTNN